MTTKQDIVREALSWKGTPWAHQQRVRGIGVDCTNFIAAVAEDSGAIPVVTFDGAYRRSTDGLTLLRLLNEHLRPVPSLSDAELGDVVTMKLSAEQWHVAIVSQVSPYMKIVHSSFERKEVVDHRLDAHLRTLIHSVWRLPNLADD